MLEALQDRKLVGTPTIKHSRSLLQQLLLQTGRHFAAPVGL
jgi:hypothetical protein